MTAIALHRLNGWQRLYLLVAVLWLPGAIFLAGRDFPTEVQWRAVASRQSYALMQEEEAEAKKVDQHCRDMPSDEMLKSFQCYKDTALERRNVKTNYSDLRKHLNTELERRIEEELATEQFKSIGKSAALWIVPLVLLYLLGMAIGWVRKGFASGV
jgi:hypothetical protein